MGLRRYYSTVVYSRFSVEAVMSFVVLIEVVESAV